LRRPSEAARWRCLTLTRMELSISKGASALFDKLDRDRDGTLDQVELRGRLTAAEIGSADPDKDGTLSKAEYLKVVEDRFKAADPDNDGTLDEKELRSGAGQKLLRLLI
jgi:Ca2+-binding EF-hand superfamily protein